MKQDHAKHHLCEALEDIKNFQDMLTTAWSKYYDHLFIKLLGTDTIPFVLMTTEAKMLRLTDSTEKIDTIYFRIEQIDREQKRLKVSLLRAFDWEDNETTSLKDVVRLEKTTAIANVDLRFISAVQLVVAQLLSREFYVESKW